jgi:ribosomal protein S18 acetylase RimI-like enzyme
MPGGGPGPEVLIRPYEPADRASVRRICHATGYMGEPVDWLWKDEESFADLFTSYYTDAEPESALVVERDGEAAGYLLGCVDTRRASNPAGIFARHFIRRAIAFRPGTAGVVWRSLADVVLDTLRRRPTPTTTSDARWPAHLHIDLLPSIRGVGVGHALMRRWLEQLRRDGVPGCHLETLGENKAAIAFFESCGFHRRGDAALVPGFRSPAGARHTVQLMVQTLSS